MLADKGKVVQAVGPAQFALGSPSGAPSQALKLRPRTLDLRVPILSLDMSSAFGTISRTWMQRSVRRHAPWLESFLAQIYVFRTHHWWPDSTATLYEVPSSWGFVRSAQPAWWRFMIGLCDVQELVHTQADPLKHRFSFCHRTCWRQPSYVLQPLPPCPLGCTPLRSSADDLCTVCRCATFHSCGGGLDQLLRAVGMRLHMGKLKVWCPAGQNALPPTLREYCTPKLPVLGNTIEKCRGNPAR